MKKILLLLVMLVMIGFSQDMKDANKWHSVHYNLLTYDFTSIDYSIKDFKASTSYSLAGGIKVIAHNDLEKFRAAYIWLVYNIRFEGEITHESGLKTLLTKKGNTLSISNAYSDVCDYLNLDCVVTHDGSHYYNIVLVNGMKFIVDISKALQKEDNSFESIDFYFMKNPYYMKIADFYNEDIRLMPVDGIDVVKYSDYDYRYLYFYSTADIAKKELDRLAFTPRLEQENLRKERILYYEKCMDEDTGVERKCFEIYRMLKSIP